MARTAGSNAADTDRRIRAAAEELFARQGYAAVSMRDIARAVGVQAGALYRYVPDKQTLLFELMRAHLESLLESWHAEVPDEDRLAQFTRFHIRFHLDRPDAVFIAYMELRNLGPANFARIETLRGDYETELGRILMARGMEPAGAAVMTRAIIAMLTGVTTWYKDGGTLSRDAVAERYVEMVRRLAGPGGEP